MSNAEIYDIAAKGIFMVWAILAVIGLREFLRLIRIVGFSSIFKFTRLSRIENPVYRIAVLR